MYTYACIYIYMYIHMHMCVKTYGSEVWNRGMERILQTGMERGYGTGVWNGCGPGPCSRPYNLTCTHMGLSQNRVPPNSNGLSSCASLKSIEMAICGYPYFQTNHDKPIFSFDLPGLPWGDCHQDARLFWSPPREAAAVLRETVVCAASAWRNDRVDCLGDWGANFGTMPLCFLGTQTCWWKVGTWRIMMWIVSQFVWKTARSISILFW